MGTGRIVDSPDPPVGVIGGEPLSWTPREQFATMPNFNTDRAQPPPAMVTVEIEYCVPCGHLSRAQELEAEILETYGQQVDRVALVTGGGGVFEVRVDGDELFDIDDDEYDADAIVDEVGTYVGATA